MPTIDLSLVSTEDLINAAVERFDVAVFHGRSARPAEPGDGAHVYSIRKKGDNHTCIGLAYSTIHFCQSVLDDGHETLPPDEL